MSRAINLIIDELVIAACEQGVNPEALADRVREAAIEFSGEDDE